MIQIGTGFLHMGRCTRWHKWPLLNKHLTSGVTSGVLLSLSLCAVCVLLTHAHTRRCTSLAICCDTVKRHGANKKINFTQLPLAVPLWQTADPSLHFPLLVWQLSVWHICWWLFFPAKCVKVWKKSCWIVFINTGYCEFGNREWLQRVKVTTCE